MTWFHDPTLQEPSIRFLLLIAAIFGLAGIYFVVPLTKITFEWIVRRLPKNEALDRKILMLNPKNNDDKRTVLKEIYLFLGILNSKAQGLMRYNGIVLAVIALMVKSGSSVSLRLGTYFIVYMTLASIVLCLFIVGVFWRFLEFVDPDDAGMEKELNLIRRVLFAREWSFQLAWWLAVGASLLLIKQFPEFVYK